MDQLQINLPSTVFPERENIDTFKEGNITVHKLNKLVTGFQRNSLQQIKINEKIIIKY